MGMGVMIEGGFSHLLGGKGCEDGRMVVNLAFVF
jgi:hypothetical protein